MTFGLGTSGTRSDRVGPWRRAVVAVLLACALPSFTVAAYGAGEDPAAPTEYELKAAFLYSFAKFVEWPDQPGSGNFALCISGGEQFKVAHEVLAGKRVRGQPVVVRSVNSATEAAGCRLLFVSAGADRMQRALEGLGGPVLTVGESGEFLRSGGMIKLVRADNRLRFEIARAAGERAGLKFSSRLLELASPVADHAH